MSETKLRCSYNLAGTILIALGVLFLVVGCASMFRRAGLSDEQAEEQAAALQAALAQAAGDAVQTIQTGLAEGQDLKVVAVKTASAFAWQMATVIVSGVGAMLSGLLAKWLKTERTMTKAMIAGVEKADKSEVKKSIEREATAAGVQPVLHKRVTTLTGG